MKRKLGIGRSNFRDIREKNKYYIDKSLFIQDFLENDIQATLITRPRRFGKTLNMSMVAEFFDITKNSEDLFAGLKIMNTPHASEINSRPVINLTFKDCKEDRSIIVNRFKSVLLDVYNKNAFAVESCDDFLKKKFANYFSKLSDDNDDELPQVDVIEIICRVINSYYKIRPLLLMDEYDTPLDAAYSMNDDKLRKFFTSMYSVTLKDNEYVGMCLLTGIQRVAKENIFSGLNNVKVYTVNDVRYNKYFGFTEDETRELLNYYDLELTEEVKKMYDGYNFGGISVYNPWSILNYADDKVLNPYWINTSSNLLIKESLKEADRDFKRNFEDLIVMGETVVSIDVQTAYSQLKETRTLWGLLLNAGYITVIDQIGDRYRIRIPNGEVKGELYRYKVNA